MMKMRLCAPLGTQKAEQRQAAADLRLSHLILAVIEAAYKLLEFIPTITIYYY